MAKTQLSLSHDPALKGRPRGFRVPVRDARLFAGAGFVTAYCGDMMMMPGLPAHPSGEDVDINAAGRDGRPVLDAPEVGVRTRDGQREEDQHGAARRRPAAAQPQARQSMGPSAISAWP